MIGQDNLINKIDNLQTLPHSILLLGQRGSGQYEVVEYIAKKFNLELIDITNLLTTEVIASLESNSTPTLYAINLVDVDDTNKLLKLYEEPNDFTYIILYGENDNSLKDTIYNRSYHLKMDEYKKDYLKELVKDKNNEELILKLCNTPGQIEIANNTNIKELYDLCNNIIQNIDKASFQNTLSISDRINFGGDYDKFDLFLFIKTLSLCLLDKNNIDIYNELINMNLIIWSLNNKKMYFEKFLSEIWRLSRDGH